MSPLIEVRSANERGSSTIELAAALGILDDVPIDHEDPDHSTKDNRDAAAPAGCECFQHACEATVRQGQTKTNWPMLA
jgi:hypothetical protein